MANTFEVARWARFFVLFVLSFDILLFGGYSHYASTVEFSATNTTPTECHNKYNTVNLNAFYNTRALPVLGNTAMNSVSIIREMMSDEHRLWKNSITTNIRMHYTQVVHLACSTGSTQTWPCPSGVQKISLS